MTDRNLFDVIVVGSGAGGGVIASELARSGHAVLLLEAGDHHTSESFRRWEAKADRDLYWPTRFATMPDGEPIAFLAGRSVGGTTTVNTKVGLRAHERDVAKWHPATGLTTEDGSPFTVAELEPYYDHVEDMLGVRERADWGHCVHTARVGFRALGADLSPVRSYTDDECMSYGSCLQGCPTDGGKSTMNTYLAWALGSSPLELRTRARVQRVLVDGSGERPRATGVEYLDDAGDLHTAHAPFVVVAAGSLHTPRLLRRSGLVNDAIGRHMGLHPLRLVYGLFDEPQDAHRVYPISAHCTKFRHDEDGGFVIEASTVMDPIAFATTIRDDDGPLWGVRLTEALRSYRHWNGLLAMANDENNGSLVGDAEGRERLEVDFQPSEQARLDAAVRFSRDVLEAAGATRIHWSGLISTHTQGSCRMGDDPERSVVDRNCESHEVEGLYVGDASLIPRTLSVNPSLTVMALATRLGAHLEEALSKEPATA